MVDSQTIIVSNWSKSLDSKDILSNHNKDHNNNQCNTSYTSSNPFLEEENATLKRQIRLAEAEFKKQIALLEQKLELKEQEFNELKISQEQMKKMNETIMSAFNDININHSYLSTNKAVKELEIATDQHNKEMNELRTRTNEIIKNHEIEIKKLNEKLSEAELNYKELILKFEKERLKFIQKIKDLEAQNISVEFYNKRYEDEKARNKEYENINHELLVKYNEIKQEIERIKMNHQCEIEKLIENYEKKLLSLQDYQDNGKQLLDEKLPKISETNQVIITVENLRKEHKMEIEILKKSMIEIQTKYQHEILALKDERDEALQKIQKISVSSSRPILQPTQTLQNNTINNIKQDFEANHDDFKSSRQSIINNEDHANCLELPEKIPKELEIEKYILGDLEKPMTNFESDYIQTTEICKEQLDRIELDRLDVKNHMSNNNNIISNISDIPHAIISKSSTDSQARDNIYQVFSQNEVKIDALTNNKQESNPNSNRESTLILPKEIDEEYDKQAHIKLNNPTNSQCLKLSNSSNNSSYRKINSRNHSLKDFITTNFLDNTINTIVHTSINKNNLVPNPNASISSNNISLQCFKDPSSLLEPGRLMAENNKFLENPKEKQSIDNLISAIPLPKSNEQNLSRFVDVQVTEDLPDSKNKGWKVSLDRSNPMKESSISPKKLCVDTKISKKKRIDIDTLPINYNEFIKKSDTSKRQNMDCGTNSLGNQTDKVIDPVKAIQQDESKNLETNHRICLTQETKITIPDEILDTKRFSDINKVKYTDHDRGETVSNRKYAFFCGILQENVEHKKKKDPNIPKFVQPGMGQSFVANKLENHCDKEIDSFHGESNMTKRHSHKISPKKSWNKCMSMQEPVSNQYDNDDKLQIFDHKIRELLLKNEGTKIEKEKTQLEVEKLKLELEIAQLEQGIKQKSYQPPTRSNTEPISDKCEMNDNINKNINFTEKDMGIMQNSITNRQENKDNTFADKENAYKNEIKFLINNLLKARNKLEKQSDELNNTKYINHMSNHSISTMPPTGSVIRNHSQETLKQIAINAANNKIYHHSTHSTFSNRGSNCTSRSPSPYPLQSNPDIINVQTQISLLDHGTLKNNINSQRSTNNYALERDILERKSKCEINTKRIPLNEANSKNSLNQAIQNFSSKINRSKSNLRSFDQNRWFLGFINKSEANIINTEGNLNQSTIPSSRNKSPNLLQQLSTQHNISTQNNISNCREKDRNIANKQSGGAHDRIDKYYTNSQYIKLDKLVKQIFKFEMISIYYINYLISLDYQD